MPCYHEDYPVPDRPQYPTMGEYLEYCGEAILKRWCADYQRLGRKYILDRHSRAVRQTADRAGLLFSMMNVPKF